jgi:DNA polymerase III subunit epsilon
MTRRIVLDTETTGLEVGRDHRVIEIGCVEMVDRQATGRVFHHYLNPDRPSDPGAIAVHGISDEFLLDKPRFAELVDAWLEFVEGAELLIHNAAFDIAFLDGELRRAGPHYGCVADHTVVVDTLALAREKYPGQKNTLDALCKRLGVDNSHRELHGALLDARLLADVWLAMTAGQGALALGSGDAATAASASPMRAMGVDATRRPVLVRADPAELEAHRARLAALDRACEAGNVWNRVESAAKGPAGD